MVLALDFELVVLKSFSFYNLMKFLYLLVSCEQLERQTWILNEPILVRLILSLLKAGELPIHLLLPAIHANLAIWHFPPTVVLDVLLKLLDSHVLELYVSLCLSVYSIVGL